MNYTFNNKELQEALCVLLGLDINGMRKLDITTDYTGIVEVTATFYAVRYQPDEKEVF